MNFSRKSACVSTFLTLVSMVPSVKANNSFLSDFTKRFNFHSKKIHDSLFRLKLCCWRRRKEALIIIHYRQFFLYNYKQHESVAFEFDSGLKYALFILWQNCLIHLTIEHWFIKWTSHHFSQFSNVNRFTINTTIFKTINQLLWVWEFSNITLNWRRVYWKCPTRTIPYCLLISVSVVWGCLRHPQGSANLIRAAANL